ncbi:MAG: hypothetical protein FK734_11600 [Asgard group archaeon]|nr:hypothetical protein [Asgard group archaeon]
MHFDFDEHTKLVIDGKKAQIPPKTNTIVTHAHSDHFSAMNGGDIKTYTTQETIDLFLCQSNISTHKYQAVNFNEKIDFQNPIEDATVKLMPSGHILGSASVHIDYKDKQYLFSSDIGGKGLLTTKHQTPIEKTDILIIEATFGSPELTFPSREETSMEMLKWAADIIKNKENVVFSTGKIGSAQEIIKLFNNFTSLRVITHGDVTPVSEVYKKHGVALEFFDSKSDEGREILKEGDAIIIQSRSKKIVPYFIKEHVNCKTAIVTGMVSMFTFKDYDAAFPLSSHASYTELMDYIQDISPEIVFTVYGQEKKLADSIKTQLNIPAIPFRDKRSDRIEPSHVFEKAFTTNTPVLSREKPTFGIETESSEGKLEKRPLTLDDFFNFED